MPWHGLPSLSEAPCLALRLSEAAPVLCFLARPGTAETRPPRRPASHSGPALSMTLLQRTDRLEHRTLVKSSAWLGDPFSKPWIRDLISSLRSPPSHSCSALHFSQGQARLPDLKPHHCLAGSALPEPLADFPFYYLPAIFLAPGPPFTLMWLQG